MSARRFWIWLIAIVALASLLRGVFPGADPPWRSTVGIPWHDEGAWTHNARNKALYGAWVQDEWNPVYIAPVFTGLEYASFTAFGVGLRQARLVSIVAGVLSVLLVGLGVRRIGGGLAGLVAAALLATNYVYVMYDRAALMEALMAAFITASWYSVTRAEREPAYGALAGMFAALAFFTKAAAAAYVAALGLLVITELCAPITPVDSALGRNIRRNIWTLGGVAISFALIAIFFVLPHWADYRFYNWQISVTRKPSYTPYWLFTRVTWFPILHDMFSRMWGALAVGVLGAWSVARGWRAAGSGERLLLLWVAIGTLELLVHDVGNERRFVFLIPALVALAGLVLARGTVFDGDVGNTRRTRLVVLSPLIFYSCYVILGPVVRLAFLHDVYAGKLKMPVRLSALGAIVITVIVLAAWPRFARLLSVRWTQTLAGALAGLAVGWNVAQFADWAMHRSYKNYDASVELGRVLAPGTLVQGKLANGLALENRIRPLFIGHGFGNYGTRKARGDVRYILTYTDPEIGYEGDQIVDVLAAYPGWRIIMTFPVAETPSGHDTAALIEKRAGH